VYYIFKNIFSIELFSELNGAKILKKSGKKQGDSTSKKNFINIILSLIVLLNAEMKDVALVFSPFSTTNS